MVPGGAGGGGGRLVLPLRIGASGGGGSIGVMGGNVAAGEAVNATVPHFVVHLQREWGIRLMRWALRRAAVPAGLTSCQGGRGLPLYKNRGWR